MKIDRRDNSAIEMSGDDFRRLGHELVDRIASFLDELPELPVTRGEPVDVLRSRLKPDGMPHQGMGAESALSGVADMLIDHSLFNGHPRFWGYITSSAAPISALADMLAATINPNVGGAILSPIASEIEAQTIRWLASLLGYPTTCGGVLVSGGNMANFVGFMVGRQVKAPWDIKSIGVQHEGRSLITYVSAETHTWIEKAAELFGQGRQAFRWIPTDHKQRMRMDLLEQQIQRDRDDGHVPIMVVGAAGTVGTGAVDPLSDIADLCEKHQLWFHVDGAYGAPAILSPQAPSQILGMQRADSIAMDPHKWLYAPLEAGCVLVRDAAHMVQTFSHHPTYYKFDNVADQPTPNYHEYGLQNSRGFRALKVWLTMRQVGVGGFRQLIDDDITLAQRLYDVMSEHPEFEAVTHNLSICTFRYVPTDITTDTEERERYVNQLNEALLKRLQEGGEVFVSNAVIPGERMEKFVLRACIVNYRTTMQDILAAPEIIARIGAEVRAMMDRSS